MSPIASFFLTLLSTAWANTLTKNLLPPDTPGGRCLDGTPTGYYLSQNADSLTSKTWVIYLEGGGACYQKEDCTKRSKSHLGSSKGWSASRDGSGLQSSDCTQNPLFCNATMVWVPYANGDTHTGNHTEKGPDTWGLYFNGHSSFALIISELKTKHNLGHATHVLLTGGSAGGIGTFMNVDWLADALPDAVVKGAPDAGWFFPGALSTDRPDQPQQPPSDWEHWSRNESGSKFNTSLNLKVSKLWQPLITGTHAACAEGQLKKKEDPLNCGSVHVLYPYIKSDVFVIENQFDTNQLFAQEGVPKQGPFDHKWLSYVVMYGEAMRASVAQVSSKPRDGIFCPACLAHGVASDELLGGGLGWLPIVSDWYWGIGKLKDKYNQVEACNASFAGLPCNAKPKCRVSHGPGPSPGPGPGPSPGPGPNPPAHKCLRALTKDCLAEIEKGEKCQECVQQHHQDLKDAGCTPGFETEICDLAPCIAGLAKSGCLPTAGQALPPCEECAEKHASALGKDGCTRKSVQQICHLA